MRDSAGSADREMGIIEESLNYKINAFKETWTGFLQELIDRGLAGQIVDFFTMLSELVTNLTSSFGALDTVMSGIIAFSITKFMGKGFINFDKENGFSLTNPFAKDKPEETIEESESARKTKEIETNVTNVETKIDELNAKEITLGSNEPAISNLEQVKTEVQEIIALEQEAANAFQATQENINRMNVNGAMNADNVDYLLNIGEVEDELDDIGRAFSDSIENTPIANTFNNVIDNQAKAWQELVEENTDVRITPYVEKKDIDAVSNEIEEEVYNGNQRNRSKRGRRKSVRQMRNQQNKSQNQVPTTGWEELATSEDRFVDTGNRATMVLESQSAAAESASVSAQSHAVAITEEASAWETLATAEETATTSYATTTAAHEQSAIASQQSAIANTEDALSATENAVANTSAGMAAMENAISQESVATASAQASVGLEAATLAADEEAIAMERAAMESGNAATALGQVGGNVSMFPSFLSGGLSKVLSLGGNVIGMLGNMAIAMLAFKAVAGIFSFIDKNIIHYNENMIKAGKEATDSIDKTVKEYEKKTNDITSISESLIDSKDENKKLETTSDAIDNLAEKYTKLSIGVDKVSNKNLSLSDEDYNTFLDTSNKIAEIMPELVTGTDNAGNSILNLGNNAEEAAEKMHTVLDAQQQMAKSDLLNNLVAQRNGILSQNSVYQKQLNKNRQSQGEAEWIFNPSNAAYYSEEELAKMEYNAKARINNLKKDEQNIQKQMKDNWKSFIPTIQDLLKLDSDFSGLNLDIQSQLLDSIGNLDTSAISKMVKDHAGNADEFTAYLNDTFIAPFQELEERGMTDRLTALFDFDNTKMTLQEYKDYINDELMTIFSTDKSQVPVWKSILGLDDLKEQQKRIGNILSDTTDDLKVTKEQFDSLTMEDRNIAYDLIVNDKFEGTFSELKKRIKETKAELNEQDLFGTPLLDKYNEAVKEVSDNGGDVGKNFDAYGAALKSLKEQYDKGLIGTDTFKKGARMFSIGGATDADNFIENYKRISKWFNDEDPAKGINKFLKDMEKLNLVKFNKDGSFVTTFDDVREGAEKAKVPLELFVSMFDKIEEFGGYNDFFATKSEGFETVGEITGELAAARAEYEKLLDTQPKNKSAIKAKEEEIKSLEDRLKAAQKTLKDFVNGDTIKEYTENYKSQRKAAQDTLKGLNDSKNFKKATDDEKKVMLEAIKSGFENSGLDSSVYKNLGINKNGRIVLDVNASNKRIDNVLDLYSNGEMDKTLQEYGGRTVEQVVSMFAKEMGLSVEDYIKKLTGGTEGTETTSQEPTDPMEKYNQVMQDSTSASRDNTNATKELTGAINTLINKDNPIERDKGIGVDLTNRPLVPSVIMNNNGWDTEKGSLSTVNTVGYTDENGKEYVVTPILPNGKVLSPEELDSYMKDIMNGGEDKEGLVLSTFTGGNARKAADDYAEALHSVQEAYYLGDDATKQSLTTLQDYTAEELRAIDLTDNFQTDMEGQFVDLMKSLNISEDQVEQFINVLEDMGLLKIEPEVDLSQITSVDKLNSTIAGQLSTGQSMTFTADVEGVNTEVKALEEVDGTIKYTVIDKDGTEKEVEPLKNQDGTITYHVVPDKGNKKDADGKKNKDGGTITQKTDVDTSGFKKGQKEVQQGVKTLSGEKATPQVNLEGATYASSQMRNLINEADRLNGKKSTMTIETIRREVIEKKYKNTHKPEGGNTKVEKFNGTFHTSNAYASGTVVSSNVSIPKDETALINELGKEMIVRDGKALTFNSGYPTFANLKKGDVVFNHKQTEELEKKGYVTGSHAKLYGTSAFASGTVDDEDEFEELSNAYAGTNISGGTKITSHTTTKKNSSTKKSTSNNNSNTGKDTGGKGKGKGKGKKKSSGDKKWDQFEKWLGQFFDWIEIRLDALSTKTEKWTSLFEKFLDAASSNATAAYNAAINAAKTQQNQSGTASDRYLQQALKVGYKGADKAGKKVTRAWVDSMYQRILDGSLDDKAIQKLSEKRKGIIEAMQGYIDKAKDAANTTEELTDSINDLIKAQRDAKVEFRNNQYSAAVEGNNGYTASTKNSGLTSSSMAAQYSIDAYNNAVNQGQAYLGQLGSTAISASNTKDATNKKILKTLKGNNKKGYTNNLSAATSAIKGGKAISESVINYFRKMNPTLAAKYTAWNTQLVNQQNARIEAADNFGKSMETIIGNVQQSYANIDEDTERAISLAQSQADNQSDYREANKVLDKLYQYQADIIANDEAEIRTYSNMRTSYANGVKSASYGGTNVGSLDTASQNVVTNLRNQIVGIVSDGKMIPDTTMETLYSYYSQGYISATFYEACRAYNMAFARGEEAQDQLRIDKEAQKQANRENFSSQISNIQTNYDNQVSKVEALKNSIAGSYDDSVTQGNTIKLRVKEYEELQVAFQKALDTGVIEKGSKEWYEYAIKIQEAKNEVNELKQTQFETVLAEKFDRAIEKAQEFIDKLETINGLITDEMLYNKDSGQLTSYGLMSLGLNSQSMASEQNNLEKYFAKRQEIIDEYAKGNTSYFGDQSFDEMITQNAKDILDSISSINSYRESIINLIEGMRDAELEALQKVVDKRKEALQKKKESIIGSHLFNCWKTLRAA